MSTEFDSSQAEAGIGWARRFVNCSGHLPTCGRRSDIPGGDCTCGRDEATAYLSRWCFPEDVGGLRGDVALLRNDVASADRSVVDRLSLLARLDAMLARPAKKSG